MTIWEKWLKDNNLTRADIICQLTKNCMECPLHCCAKTKAYDEILEKYLNNETKEGD